MKKNLRNVLLLVVFLATIFLSATTAQAVSYNKDLAKAPRDWPIIVNDGTNIIDAKYSFVPMITDRTDAINVDTGQSLKEVAEGRGTYHLGNSRKAKLTNVGYFKGKSVDMLYVYEGARKLTVSSPLTIDETIPNGNIFNHFRSTGEKLLETSIFFLYSDTGKIISDISGTLNLEVVDSTKPWESRSPSSIAGVSISYNVAKSAGIEGIVKNEGSLISWADSSRSYGFSNRPERIPSFDTPRRLFSVPLLFDLSNGQTDCLVISPRDNIWNSNYGVILSDDVESRYAMPAPTKKGYTNDTLKGDIQFDIEHDIPFQSDKYQTANYRIEDQLADILRLTSSNVRVYDIDNKDITNAFDIKVDANNKLSASIKSGSIQTISNQYIRFNVTASINEGKDLNPYYTAIDNEKGYISVTNKATAIVNEGNSFEQILDSNEATSKVLWPTPSPLSTVSGTLNIDPKTVVPGQVATFTSVVQNQVAGSVTPKEVVYQTSAFPTGVQPDVSTITINGTAATGVFDANTRTLKIDLGDLAGVATIKYGVLADDSAEIKKTDYYYEITSKTQTTPVKSNVDSLEIQPSKLNFELNLNIKKEKISIEERTPFISTIKNLGSPLATAKNVKYQTTSFPVGVNPNLNTLKINGVSATSQGIFNKKDRTLSIDLGDWTGDVVIEYNVRTNGNAEYKRTDYSFSITTDEEPTPIDSNVVSLLIYCKP